MNTYILKNFRTNSIIRCTTRRSRADAIKVIEADLGRAIDTAKYKVEKVDQAKMREELMGVTRI